MRSSCESFLLGSRDATQLVITVTFDLRGICYNQIHRSCFPRNARRPRRQRNYKAYVCFFILHLRKTHRTAFPQYHVVVYEQQWLSRSRHPLFARTRTLRKDATEPSLSCLPIKLFSKVASLNDQRPRSSPRNT